jgi:hypothetical protein
VAGVSVGLLPQGWQVETRIGSRLLIPRKAQSGHTRDTRGRQEEVWRGKHWGGGGSLVRAGKPSAMVLMVGAGQLKRRHARAPKLHRARYTRTSVVRTARTVHKLKACEYLVRITDSRICFLPFFLFYSTEKLTSRETTMPENAEERASLVNRQLPEMALSTAANPLTAPRPPPDNLTGAQRVAYRFQVKGNAIST